MQTDDTVISQKLTVERRCPTCNVLVPQELERCPNDGTVLSVSPLVDSELSNRYEFLEPIGKGGMSVVYKARHKLMGSLVAIKLLQDRLSDNPSYAKRFQLEAKAAGSLDHQSLIKVYDFGILPTGASFLVMDYADGASLSEVVRAEGPLSADRALPLFLQMCEGLAHAHAKGVLHRDLKPSNVIVIREGETERAKIVDFGIAKIQAGEDGKLTTTGEVFGSPLYMSPEQCTGGTVDKRSDVYAMGCLMYETLSGKLPVAGSNVFETIHKQITEVPESLTKLVPDKDVRAIAPIVAKALKKDPLERYQSFDEMLKDLYALAQHGRVKVQNKLSAGTVLAWGIGAASVFLATTVAACYFFQTGPFAPPMVPVGAIPRAPQVVAVAPPPTPMFSALPVDKSAADLDEEEDFAAKTIKETNWILGMSQSFANGQKEYSYPTHHSVNLVQYNVKRKDIAELARDPSGVKLNLQGNPSIDDDALIPLKDHPSVQVLRLTGASISGKSIDDVFTTMPKLAHLMVGHTKISPDDFPKFAKIKKLDDLWLDESNLTDADLEKLPILPELSKLRLDGNEKLTNASISIIARKFPGVTTLSLRRLPLTDAILPTLASMGALRQVRVAGTNITVAGIQRINQNTPIIFTWDQNIEAGTKFAQAKQDAWKKADKSGPVRVEKRTFTLEGPRATNGMLLAAAQDDRVRTLVISNAPKVTMEGMIGFRNRALHRFNIRGAKLDASFFELLKSIKNLKFVSITNCQFDHRLLRKLDSCGDLISLDVNGTLHSKADLLNLPRQITDLNISNSPWFNNSCVAVVRKRCPQLTWWHFEHTGVDDACVEELDKIFQLRMVIATRGQLTDTGVGRLRARKVTVNLID